MSQQNDREIDLSEVGKKISGFFDSIANLVYLGFLFIKRNIIILAALFILGAGLGIYLDRTKIYDSRLIVTPNFGSVDYLYSKIDLISGKMKEGDTVFLKNTVGLRNTDHLAAIEIKPITDIYQFINNREQNFELIKLMAEDGNIDNILKDEVTSKNYSYQQIVITTVGMTDEASTITPLLDYLNKDAYYNKLKTATLENIRIKTQKNDSLIAQIDRVLNSVSSSTGQGKGGNMIYYNQENAQLNDVLKTKDQLVSEQGNNRIALIASDKVIKESSVTTNIRNTKSMNGKYKLILPVLFLGFFFAFSIIRAFFKSMAKSTQ